MDEYIHIRVKKELKEYLIAMAKKKNISLNAYVNLILNERKG